MGGMGVGDLAWASASTEVHVGNGLPSSWAGALDRFCRDIDRTLLRRRPMADETYATRRRSLGKFALGRPHR